MVAPAHGGPGQLVEQPPSRVGGPAEQALVGNGNTQDRQLHTRHQRLQRHRQFIVIQHHVKQHGHQTDDIVIDPIQLAHLAGLLLLLTQLTGNMPPQITQRGRLISPRRSKPVQHAKQLFTAHRRRRRCPQRTERNITTGMPPAADQITEQRKHLLLRLPRCRRTRRSRIPLPRRRGRRTRALLRSSTVFQAR